MPDSLFGSDSDPDTDLDHDPALTDDSPSTLASSSPPPIPGLFVLHHALPQHLHDHLAQHLSAHVWAGHSDQVMLFERPSSSSSTLPPFLDPLLAWLPSALSFLPPDVQHLVLDSPLPRQAILNLYRPGQGISPHVDLPTRYTDGIVAISLLSSTVYDFRPATAPPTAPPTYALRVRPRDVVVLSGDARWHWSHGIAYRDEDVVADEEGEPMVLRRGTRMSVTLRRMREGAHVVGPERCVDDDEGGRGS
ncbi:uncharacterized protein RHOBADRAFT_42209 [Rhodotorula graminis WP1]|uniref:Fe2OG dioxygenase domain-containing protein n=1 Tax=Rhodotorula graminis (strain WP1) TaxID=578459 RepID=A0A194SC73_RHOGW|nr:uncharacterized protein RHOBADRAFT_42209 [Rhodotorula graminis WP1]KPV76996.1 hypothetical protein RHOBADRAFT_42209 [Rhodotorula graminis WP1]